MQKHFEFHQSNPDLLPMVIHRHDPFSHERLQSLFVFTMISLFTDILKDERCLRIYSNLMKRSAKVQHSRVCCEFLKVCQDGDVIPNTCRVHHDNSFTITLIKRPCLGCFSLKLLSQNYTFLSAEIAYISQCHLWQYFQLIHLKRVSQQVYQKVCVKTIFFSQQPP